MYYKVLHIAIILYLFTGVLFAQKVNKNRISLELNEVYFDSVGIIHFDKQGDGYKVYANLRKFCSVKVSGKREIEKATGLGWFEIDDQLNIKGSDYRIFKKKAVAVANAPKVIGKLAKLGANLNKHDLYENKNYRAPIRDNIVAKYEDMILRTNTHITNAFPDLKDVPTASYPSPMYSNKIKHEGLWSKPELFVENVLDDDFNIKGEMREIPLDRYASDTKHLFWCSASAPTRSFIDGSVHLHNKLVDKKKDKKAPFEEKIEFVTFDKDGKEKHYIEAVFNKPYDHFANFSNAVRHPDYDIRYNKDRVFIYNGNPNKKFPDLKRSDLRIFYQTGDGQIVFDQEVSLVNEKSKVIHAFMNNGEVNLVAHSWKAETIETTE